MAYAKGGDLLVASAGGLRIVDSSGCPREGAGPLHDAPVLALTATGGASDVVYAVAGGDAAGVWRSDDGGVRWRQQSTLPADLDVSGLQVHPEDPEQLYMSVLAPDGSSTVHASADGGVTFAEYPDALGLHLLRVRPGPSARLWARSRDAQTVGNRGWAILRADAPGGPWTTQTRVGYFGGFEVTDQGTILVGDELGGVLRSEDDGESFAPWAVDVPVASLAFGDGQVWAVTPGVTATPIVRVLEGDRFADVLTLTDVDRLVQCPAHDVERVCAAAWVEWQRDVLGQTPVLDGGAGAGPSPWQDAAPDAAGEAGSRDAAQLDASAAREDATAAGPTDGRSTERSAGCAAAVRTGPHAGFPWLLGVLGLLGAARRRSGH